MNLIKDHKMDTFEMEYQSVDDIDEVKNRNDKSKLSIYSMHPERFLAADIAQPDQVKHLVISLPFNKHEEEEFEQKYLFKKDCGCSGKFKDFCNKCTWWNKYSETLCCGIVHFNNLEILEAEDFKLSNVLWTQFAQNSKILKEIYFSTDGGEYDEFWFEEGKEEALTALFRIPTLEKVRMNFIDLSYFPPGPSNIKHLELDRIIAEDKDLRKLNSYSWKKNFSTHTNITSLVLTHRSPTPYHLEDLRLDKMVQLEKIVLKNWNTEYIEPVLMLPNLKRFEFTMWYDSTDPLMKSLTKNPDAVFPSVEHIVIKVTNFPSGSDFSKAKKYLKVVLSKQCINLKSFTFIYT